MARLLLVAGGCRGLELAGGLVAEGNAVRITTRGEAGRAAIEAVGAECWVGTPDRVESLRYALEHVSLLGVLLGTAGGDAAALGALHGPRLRFLLSQAIDTSVRGVIYEGAGSVDAELLDVGAAIVREVCELNSIPQRVLDTDPADRPSWLAAARGAVTELL